MIQEPLGGAHREIEQHMRLVKKALKHNLAGLQAMSMENLLARRYERLMKVGR